MKQLKLISYNNIQNIVNNAHNEEKNSISHFDVFNESISLA